MDPHPIDEGLIYFNYDLLEEGLMVHGSTFDMGLRVNGDVVPPLFRSLKIAILHMLQ